MDWWLFKEFAYSVVLYFFELYGTRSFSTCVSQNTEAPLTYHWVPWKGYLYYILDLWVPPEDHYILKQIEKTWNNGPGTPIKKMETPGFEPM